MGFTDVYDYVLGKADWLAHNLPVDGEQAQAATAGRAARDDVVTCGLEAPIGPLRETIDRSPYGFALVTTAGGVLMGRLRRSALGADPDAPAEHAMEPGPSTVRADAPVRDLAQRLADRDLETAIVTTPEGRLIGVVPRGDLKRGG